MSDQDLLAAITRAALEYASTSKPDGAGNLTDEAKAGLKRIQALTDDLPGLRAKLNIPEAVEPVGEKVLTNRIRKFLRGGK